MEYWDLYTKDRKKLNKLHKRGEPLNIGEYHIFVFAWIINKNNEILIIQRHPNKTFPYKWDCVGGAVLAGEESIDAILREVEEEIGIKISKENGKLIKSDVLDDFIGDVYIFKEDINIEETKLQDMEVINIKLVGIEKLKKMEKENKLPKPMIHNIEYLEECLKEI
jgi:8-oxo-dGTP pyrophosphatase MutT (NUDIX family)